MKERALLLTDAQINAYILERKRLALDGARKIFHATKSQDSGTTRVRMVGVAGSEFAIILRRSKGNPDDYSFILGLVLESQKLFHLRRYNGPSHFHRNKIEKNQFSATPHIHFATERYQTKYPLLDVESYAEPSTAYHDASSAWNLIIQDCNITITDPSSGEPLPI
jgi:hypothetical protein